MRMEPLQFHSRQFSRIFLKKNTNLQWRSENLFLVLWGATLKSLKPVRDFNNQAHQGSTQISGCRPSPLTGTLNANKGMILKNHPKTSEISPWIIWARVFFFPIADNKRTVFFLWWLKSPPFLWDSSRQCGPAGSAALPNLCSRWGTLLFWKSWAPTQKKPNHHFPWVAIFHSVLKDAKTEMK